MKYFEEIVKEIKREELINYYWVENHTFKECCEHFNIGQGQFARLLKHYDAKKPDKLRVDNILKSKESKYGSSTYNNREKAKATCLEKYGVDNPFKDVEHIRNSFKEKYGVEHPMQVEEFKNKCVENHDYEEIFKKCKDTYYKKTGYDNPWKNPEVIKNGNKHKGKMVPLM